jgi:hypothetical protein
MDIITRQEAKAQGLKRYFTGLACKHGHVAERLVSNRGCYQCILEHSQQPDVKTKAAERKKTPEAKAQKADYYQANRAERLAQNAAYAKANRAAILAQKAANYQVNRSEILAQIAAYAKANPHLINAKAAKRRAAKRQATPRWADFEDIKVIYKQCAERTRLTGIPHAVDHVYPLISDEVCGLHVAANLQILTAFENSSKHNRMPAPEQVPSDLD